MSSVYMRAWRDRQALKAGIKIDKSRHRNMVKFNGQWYVLQRNMLKHYHKLFAQAEEAFDVPTFEGISGKSDVTYIMTLRDLYKVIHQQDLFDQFKKLYGEKRLKNMQQKFMIRELHG